jgi:hypothetical protein
MSPAAKKVEETAAAAGLDTEALVQLITTRVMEEIAKRS